MHFVPLKWHVFFSGIYQDRLPSIMSTTIFLFILKLITRFETEIIYGIQNRTFYLLTFCGKYHVTTWCHIIVILSSFTSKSKRLWKTCDNSRIIPNNWNFLVYAANISSIRRCSIKIQIQIQILYLSLLGQRPLQAYTVRKHINKYRVSKFNKAQQKSTWRLCILGKGMIYVFT